jgi:3-hydroxyacyl-[acyl-carrier-protein] dehydratase
MDHSNESTGLLFQSTIQRILPHRYPSLLVDRVTEFVPGQRIVGIKHFSTNDTFAPHGAYDPPVIPTGILIESITQLGAILVLERPQMAGKIAVILQIPSARMLKPVQAGDTLRLQAEVAKLGELFGELRGDAHRDGDLVAEGTMRFAIANASDLKSQASAGSKALH